MTNDLLRKIIELDYKSIEERIVSFLRYEARSNAKNMFILGLSGGIDSSVVAKLASLSDIDTLGLIIPYADITPMEDINDAIELAKNCNIKHQIINVDNIYNEMLNLLPYNKHAAGNLLARLRMCILYYYANLNNGLVLGTGDRSELLIGYFTKYGDGAADLLPIASLYKLQVREFAKRLGIDEKIIKKRSSPRLWKDHLIEEELGLSYVDIDCILYCLFDMKLGIDEITKIIDERKVRKVIDLHRNANHKRVMPKLCLL